MNYEKYFEFISDKKTQINYMHQVIKKGIEENNHTTVQYEILLRGYIVLIYSFWEGSYKKLPFYFFEGLKETTIENLPYQLKDKILKEKINLEKNKKVRSYRCLDNFYTEINNFKKTRCELDEKLIEFFKNNSNNPNVNDLEKLLGLYHFSVSIEEELKKEIIFIINSRNDIAHSGVNVSDYHKKIVEEFNINVSSSDENSKIEVMNKLQEISKIEVMNKLQEILNNMFILYKTIADKFSATKAMHTE